MDTFAADYIQNKPTLVAVATARTYASLTGPSPGFSAVYNGGALQTNTKLWTGQAKTSGGRANFYPTSTNVSGGTIFKVHTDAVYTTTNGTLCPCTSIYSIFVRDHAAFSLCGSCTGM